MVKRYEAWRVEDDYHYRIDLVEHVNGQYVLASDYDALAVELEAVKSELEKWQREAIKHQAAADKVGESLLNLHEWGYHCKEEFDALAAELEAVKAERDALVKRINHDGTPVDIASLCAEIDTVTDELARVKAESLRVVKDGVAGPFDDMDARFIEYNNHIYQWNEVLDHDKSAIPIYGGRPVGIRLNNRDVPVQPVRLKRWENCDETD